MAQFGDTVRWPGPAGIYREGTVIGHTRDSGRKLISVQQPNGQVANVDSAALELTEPHPVDLDRYTETPIGTESIGEDGEDVGNSTQPSPTDSEACTDPNEGDPASPSQAM